MKRIFILFSIAVFVFSACQKKDGTGFSSSNINTNSPTIINPASTTDSPKTIPIQYFNGDFHGITPISDSIYKNTVFSVRYISVDSFVIATPDYLPYHEFAFSGYVLDSIIYGFKKNNTENYYSHFNNDYTVHLVFIKDSAYLHMFKKDGCFDQSTGEFAGKKHL
jgi:hypothetical protein